MTPQPSHPATAIAYGKHRLPLVMDPAVATWDVIAPRDEPALLNPQEAFRHAARNPIGVGPLCELVKPGEKIVIVTADGTRPVPNKQLVPWILDEMGIPDSDVTILIGTGSHRANTPEELEAMFGADIARRVRIVNHDAFARADNRLIGRFGNGGEAWLNKEYVEADKRVVLGFIEPHFFAGFSGGAKGIMPGVAGIDSILHFHNFNTIAHPNSAYGVTDDNPTRDMTREVVAMCPPHFMVNVTLNQAKEITEFFIGDYLEAHDLGCAHVKAQSMVPVSRRYPIVITSNSGFPLDQNLYQAVKALAVATRIVEDGGTIFLVSECSDGLPSHGNFGKEMAQGLTARELLAKLQARQHGLDQWQVQVLLNTVLRCEVVLKSTLPDDVARACYVEPCGDLQATVEAKATSLPGLPRVAVLPEGPLTIPYLEEMALAR